MCVWGNTHDTYFVVEGGGFKEKVGGEVRVRVRTRVRVKVSGRTVELLE